VEVLNGPKLWFVVAFAAYGGCEGLAFGRALQDVYAGRGVEHVPSGHGLVAVAFFGEHLRGRPVPFHLRQGLPASPPVVERFACLDFGNSELVKLVEIDVTHAHGLHATSRLIHPHS